MDAVTSKHPSDRALSSFALGKLDDKSAAAVGKHVEGCPDCRTRVADMSADSFHGQIRDAQASGEHAFSQSQTSGADSRTTPEAQTPPPANTLPPGLADHPNYEIKGELGRGGMGVVYLAHNKIMGRDEVLKVMGPHLMGHPGALDRFKREIQSVARLRHPNIVTAYHANQLGQSLLFAMEYVEGRDLSKLVESKGPMPVAHACLFIHQAALGLQHAHEEGLIHRDLKPNNLILYRKGNQQTVKILDFGLAKAGREKVEAEQKSSGQSLTGTGATLGTPAYMAPEQITDASTADIRADIYSLGATLYYLLAGRPPFVAKSLYDLYQAHISQIAAPLNQVRSDVPAALAALVAKMMAKDPSQRFQTPGEVAQALTPYFKEDSRDQDGSPEPAPAATPRQWPPWVRPAVAAGVFVIGFLAASVLRVKTPEGDLVFSALPERSVVTVDGKVCTVEWPGGNGPAIVTVPAGDHRVKVELNGIEVYGEEVSIETGKKKWITVRLDSLPASRPGKDDTPASSAELREAVAARSPTDVSPQSARPGHGGGDSIITNSIGMKLVLIPSGAFLMGSPDSDNGFAQTEDHPVVNVSWNDAVAFCGWLSGRDGLKPFDHVHARGPWDGAGYRLPTEAEWEYACRAGTTTRYQSGDDPETAATVGNVADGTARAKYPGWTTIAAQDGYVYTAPVGRFRANAFGLYDMQGNVWEWCWDWYHPDYYKKSPGADPLSSSQATWRVFRGELPLLPAGRVGVPLRVVAGAPELQRGVPPGPSPVFSVSSGGEAEPGVEAGGASEQSRRPDEPERRPAAKSRARGHVGQTLLAARASTGGRSSARCNTHRVRRAFLLGEGASDRRLWIDNRLQELAGIFSIAFGGYSVLDNHLHVLVRLDPDLAAGWSVESAFVWISMGMHHSEFIRSRSLGRLTE